MVTREQIIQAAPRFLDPGRNWAGMCEAAAWNLTNVLSPGHVRSFYNATAAREASKIEGDGYGPGGNFVWMSGVISRTGRDDGHVAYHLGGGLAFMASSSVTDRIPGFRALGFVDLGHYLRRFPNQKLEGWSYDHGGTVIPGDGPIVAPPIIPTTIPAAPVRRIEDDMTLLIRASSEYAGYIPAGWVFLQEPNGTLRALAPDEVVAHTNKEVGYGREVLVWSGRDIGRLVERYGLREYTGSTQSDDPGDVTDRLIYGMDDGDRRYKRVEPA